MEKIGDFAKRCEVTIKALRYYDLLGLLVPDYIDKFTGYRYYGMEKVAEMRRITELKDIGFTLEEIKLFCKNDNEDKKAQVLREKRQSLEQLITNTERQFQKLSKLERKGKKMNNNINITFENDERVVGRWEIIASVEIKQDFIPAKENCKNESPFEEIYFLPGGKQYWGFSWTKGYLKITFGNGMLCAYELEEISGEAYMFIYTDYRGKIWVLKQTDNKEYTKYEIGRHDDINLPFVNDEAVIGTWTAVDFVKKIEDFDPAKKGYKDLFYVTAEFLPEGVLHNYFDFNMYKNQWTKGTTLCTDGDGDTAPAYEMRSIEGVDYLFIEWKSGDYIWGKRDPQYYVFMRG